jgi:hypothetical protein
MFDKDKMGIVYVGETGDNTGSGGGDGGGG